LLQFFGPPSIQVTSDANKKPFVEFLSLPFSVSGDTIPDGLTQFLIVQQLSTELFFKLGKKGKSKVMTDILTTVMNIIIIIRLF